MILTHDVILEELRLGRMVIDPFDAAMVGAASVDLHLGDEIRVMDRERDSIDVDDDADYARASSLRVLNEPYPLAAGETIHGITRERIRLPPNICGWLEGRSRFARLGLMIHVTAGFVAPGIDNRQVLEISNLSGRELRIHPGTRLCQIVLQRTEGEAVYRGRFANQLKP